MLSRCRGGCYEAQYSYGRVAWIQGNRVHGYDPATRKRRSWPMPPIAPGAVIDLRFNAFEALIVSWPADAPQRGTLYAVAWPLKR